jgi:hypothetical protein
MRNTQGTTMKLRAANEERLDAMINELKLKYPDYNITVEEKNGCEVLVRLTPKPEKADLN